MKPMVAIGRCMVALLWLGAAAAQTVGGAASHGGGAATAPPSAIVSIALTPEADLCVIPGDYQPVGATLEVVGDAMPAIARRLEPALPPGATVACHVTALTSWICANREGCEGVNARGVIAANVTRQRAGEIRLTYRRAGG